MTVPFSEDLVQNFVIKGVLWGFTYYFIRRGLNPEVEDVEKYKQDAIYGSLAALISAILLWIFQTYVIPYV